VSTEPLDARSYSDVMPLSYALRKDGAFFGVLDLETWGKLTREQRVESLDKLSARLASQGLADGATIGNGFGITLISDQAGKLFASERVLSLDQAGALSLSNEQP